MSTIDTKKFLAHLNDKWSNKQCPYCGGSFEVQSRIFEIKEYNYPHSYFDDNVGNSSVPVIPAICKKCGNTVFISAVYSHFLKADGDKINE